MAMRATAVAIVLCLSQTLGAQTLEHVSIGQVVNKAQGLEAYLDVRATGDVAVDALPATSLEVTMDGRPLPVSSLKPFAKAGEGIGYVFLVDISGSESKAEFSQVKGALQVFVDHMDAVDRAAIITFGAQTATVVSYTGDKTLLKKDISGLVNNAPMTQLNKGLIEGLQLAHRLDADLPARRSIVVLSDGKDEGSGFTEDDVLRVFQDNRVPIYAVGASNLPKPDKARYLEVLHRYALLSGGAFYDASSGSVETAYSQIHDRIARMWVADLDCASCAKDGRSSVLRVQVTVNGESLADKLNVTYVPVAAAKPTTSKEPPAPPKPWWKRQTRATYAGAGAAALILLLGLIILIARRKNPLPPAIVEEAKEEFSGPGMLIPSVPPASVLPTASNGLYGVTQPLPIMDDRPGIIVELARRDTRSVSRDSYSAKLVDRIVVGRSSEADLQIPDPSVSNQHCELEMVGGRICVSDLGSTYGTFLNGIPVKNRQRLEPGDILAFGSIEFRVKV